LKHDFSAYTGRLHFLNVQYEDYLLSNEKGAVVGKYLCVVFNPFLRTSADGDDQRIGQAERPGELSNTTTTSTRVRHTSLLTNCTSL